MFNGDRRLPRTSNPLQHIVSTDASGSFTTTLTIVDGTTGPPATGTDSSGGDAATDAAAYPCPPTPAQQAAGVTCVIGFGDLAGEQATAPVLFVGEEPPTSTTTVEPTTTTTTVEPTTTTTTVEPTTTTTTVEPTTTTTTVEPTTTTTVPKTCRPGWGFGDKHHCHTGPRGLHHGDPCEHVGIRSWSRTHDGYHHDFGSLARRG